jgi:hypothetical protein
LGNFPICILLVPLYILFIQKQNICTKDQTIAYRDESGTDIIRPTDRPTERVRHSNGKTVSESGHLIFVTIRTALVSGNSKLNFYYPNMMNITIRHKMYCPYPNPIREFRPRKKNYLYLYLQYPFVSDPFSSLFCIYGITFAATRR